MEVWQAIREDRERGAKRLVSEYGNRLFAAAVLLCPNDSDAEELVYKSFDQAIKKIGLYQPKSDFFSWLYVIMLNFRRMDLRKRKAEVIPVGAPCDLPEMCSPSVMAVLESCDSDAVRAAVRGISEPLREVVVLRYFEDLSIGEIARILHLSEGTVKSRLYNARAALYARLSKKEEMVST